MIPIFCINLERATERKEHIEKHWIKKLDLTIEFWKAYDRRDISKGKLIFPYDYETTIKNIHRPMSEGEIACATSFAMLYQHLIKNKIPEAIIMEDDVFPTISDKNNLFDVIQAGKEEFPEATVFLLHQPSIRELINEGRQIYYYRKQHFSLCEVAPWGNLLFYIRLEAVKEYFKLLRIINNVADNPQRILSSDAKVIISNKPLCYHIETSQSSYTSYIGNEHRIEKSNRIFIQ